MIYVFGNSHAHFFTDSTPSKFGEGEKSNDYFRSFSLGPVIAYNFQAHHLPTMVSMMNKLPITDNDYVMLAVGEVDCRWHLPKYAAKNGWPIEVIVKECVDRFFAAHELLHDNGFKVIAWGGHPSTTAGHSDIEHSPIYGDCLSRNAISLLWSDYLEEKSKKKGVKFVSIIRDLINVDGLTKMEYYKDYCHLDSAKFLPSVIEKFQKEGLICGTPQKK